MKIIKILTIVISCLFVCCTSKKETIVHLKGQLTGMEENPVIMAYDGSESLIGNSKDILLQTDENGCFDTILSISEPEYYKIYGYSLYLTPGDDMMVEISAESHKAEFWGKGSQINNYLVSSGVSKAGCFLRAGMNMKSNYAETKRLIDSLAVKRFNQLDSLTEITDEVRIFEKKRILAEKANSYICYPIYRVIYDINLRNNDEAARIAKDSMYKEIIPDILPILKELNDDEFLDIAVVRDVMSYAADKNNEISPVLTEGITVSPYMRELYTTAQWVDKLRGSVSQELVDEANQYLLNMKNAEFVIELRNKIEQVSRLLKGKPAIDFEMTDAEGNIHKLSDFKGKVIYLDFWATWCGPCVYESPYFEKLAKEFEGKDIVFIPISTDNDKEAWIQFITLHKKELPQYNSLDKKITSDWMLYGIPRFIIIDKEFNIVDANAPRPSQPETKDILSSLVK